jgi:ribosome biogenesis GTPase A
LSHPRLWRVLERSDVVLLVADVRNPSLHIPPALYSHLAKKKTPLVIVLSKVDLVPPEHIEAWKAYIGRR